MFSTAQGDARRQQHGGQERENRERTASLLLRRVTFASSFGLGLSLGFSLSGITFSG